MQKKLDENQQQMLQLQEQGLERLAIIQNRIQAVIAQTYELHEYPIPRLFIVLPKHTGFPNMLKNSLTKTQFRLFFLCECGDHTKVPGSNTPHHIHLAKHEGYDIERPNEFFENYGSYILIVLQLVKYGTLGTSIALPLLATDTIFQSLGRKINKLSEKKDFIGVTGASIESLINESISYIQNKQNTGGAIGDIEGQTVLEKVEALEGADLRRLQSFLRVQDQSRTLGDLYRIVTLEGHVKWVCFDHYRENYKESAVQRLKEVVAANEGDYDEKHGSIKVCLKSRFQAKQFYDAMVQARGIHELSIQFGWRATEGDVADFATATTESNLVGVSLKDKPISQRESRISFWLDSGSRYNPLAWLMSNKRVRSMKIEAIEDFFLMSDFVFKEAPELRSLDIVKINISPCYYRRTLRQLLIHCPNLVKLTLGTIDNILTLNNLLYDTLPLLQTLKSLELQYESGVLRNKYLRGTTLESSMEFYHPMRICEDDVVILSEKRKGLHSYLLNIMSNDPKLTTMLLTNVYDYHKVIERVITARKKMISLKGSCALETLMIKHRGESSEFTIAVVRCLDAFDSESLKIDMNLTGWTKLSTEPIHHMLKCQGSLIKKLNIGSEFDDSMAVALDKSTRTNGSKLSTLDINCGSLTPVGRAGLACIIQRSPSIVELKLYTGPSKDTIEQGELSCGGSVKQLMQIVKWVQERQDLPNLQKLWVDNYGESISSFLQWTVKMVAAPAASEHRVKPLRRFIWTLGIFSLKNG
ncbi:hypothetical protein BCR41DRAFT_400864 [Lobosporangium transversale]|uniref:Uncharacterized protein n=1 Tax=Lobosporangium transversale TaxID=64571 RepID=A0A1Y2G9G7_9FUNG|nr:hypothetical protein BCR41DRAFT_400864 [Lobosporangium transversale]ORZ04844.1 hypothetical protein BCR41DRAFT_400864 [Lobosporangium transversale]|eukprot:XP_021876781.1 hypothetical protein BCR41DRAFT_400864 [Lobosporangium transversale]